MSARYAGIDHGVRRIGIAVSDPLGSIASPLDTLNVSANVDEQVRQVLDTVRPRFDIDEWVVGLPLNMDGSEGRQAKMSRRFAERLAEASGAPVNLWDERLSSRQADDYLAQAGLTRAKKKARRDKLAAQVILQSFLETRPRPAE